MRALLFALLLSLTACTIAPEKARPGWSGATSAEQYERLFWDAVKAKDWKQIDAHLGGTVVTQTPDAVRNKQQTMEHVRQLNLTDYSIGDVQTETNGADLIITYTITIRGTINGAAVPEKPMRMMSVWQHASKIGMIMVAHATMPAAQ